MFPTFPYRLSNVTLRDIPTLNCPDSTAGPLL